MKKIVRHIFQKSFLLNWFDSKDTLACYWCDLEDPLALKGLKGKVACPYD